MFELSNFNTNVTLQFSQNKFSHEALNLLEFRDELQLRFSNSKFYFKKNIKNCDFYRYLLFYSLVYVRYLLLVYFSAFKKKNYV